MIILGIETSCDDTSVALYKEKKGIICQESYNQSYIHKKYKGIVPNLASKYHLLKIIPLIKYLLKKSKILISKINAIAYTAGPGLIGSLLIGSSVANALALSLNIPVIPINHMEGHIFSPFLNKKNHLTYPFISLLVSGKHTNLVLIKKFNKYKILGKSLDDAAGEVFDKIATLLEIPYPGAKKLSMLAKKKLNNKFVFPQPMLNKPGLNFSFSGLKTHVTNVIKKNENSDQIKANIAFAFEHAIVNTLTIKCKRAIESTGVTNLLISGGFSKNLYLRKKINHMMKYFPNSKIYYPDYDLCTDNGSMIAYVGFLRFKIGKYTVPNNILVFPKLSIEKCDLI
ncbi:tRNA (adenosine(37)-N6)-threonylcarbamoyltransferase complex transferase subunit TsaD [Buchnera aphidicola (Taiwanaphis decaspermi)]|uniref:tRNA (adenosine(37)-N6)-threonylcarbamoyltransferase complex transferase subunit TsaD n=1 Tax=Buchnera aphidicola TaxID=9 RepID=UPI0031B86B23